MELLEILRIPVFAMYVLIILGGGIMAVISKSLVRALVGLIATLFGVAGMYLLLQTPFLAFMQLLIYVGAVSVLIFFAIMLTHAHGRGEEGQPPSERRSRNATLTLVIPAVVLAFCVIAYPVKSLSEPEIVPVADIGQQLLGPYTLAFEMISIVLLVAMAGAVMLAFERRGKR